MPDGTEVTEKRVVMRGVYEMNAETALWVRREGAIGKEHSIVWQVARMPQVPNGLGTCHPISHIGSIANRLRTAGLSPEADAQLFLVVSLHGLWGLTEILALVCLLICTALLFLYQGKREYTPKAYIALVEACRSKAEALQKASGMGFMVGYMVCRLEVIVQGAHEIMMEGRGQKREYRKSRWKFYTRMARQN